jgi:hypothetical protein
MYVTVTGKGRARVIQFVEQHRIPHSKKKKTVVIETLGNYEKMLAENPRIMEELREIAIQRTLEKKESRQAIPLSYLPQALREEEDALPSYSFGHAVLEKFWRELELEACFSDCLRGRKNLPRLIAAMKGLLFHRILDPASVLYTRKELSQFAGYKSDYLDLYYEALDAFDACREVMIEHLCRQYEKRTDRKGPIAYYDVTTYAFESVRAGELRLFGFSKEHKNNEVQVVMGLLMDSQGMPISYTLFPGNTMDQSTLETAVADLKKRYRMEKIVVVADRGLNSKDNLHYLVGEGHDFVMSYSLKKAPRDLQDLIFDEDGWQEQRDGEGKLLARTKRAERMLDVKRLLTEEEKLLLPVQKGRPRKYTGDLLPVTVHLIWRTERASKDRSDRERILEKVRADLTHPGRVKAQARRGRSQYIQYDADYSGAVLDEARVAWHSQFDGYSAVITNKPELSTGEVSEIYGGLWKIEESFRITKSDLEACPVFVWTDGHIRGHFALCFLGLCFHRYLQFLLRKEGQDLSAASIRHALSQAKVIVQGSYPMVMVSPTGVSKEFLELWKAAKLPALYSCMKLSEFKKATQLDLSVNLEK